MINSAGTSGPNGAFHEIDDAGWSETIEVDLMGPVRVSRAFLDDLRVNRSDYRVDAGSVATIN